ARCGARRGLLRCPAEPFIPGVPTMLRLGSFRYVFWIVPVICAAWFLGTAPAADDDLNVLPSAAGNTSPRKMLSEYLLGQCKQHFDARRQAVAKLTTADEIKKRQQDLRAKFIESLGGFPEKTPLNA